MIEIFWWIGLWVVGLVVLLFLVSFDWRVDVVVFGWDGYCAVVVLCFVLCGWWFWLCLFVVAIVLVLGWWGCGGLFVVGFFVVCCSSLLGGWWFRYRLLRVWVFFCLGFVCFFVLVVVWCWRDGVCFANVFLLVGDEIGRCGL